MSVRWPGEVRRIAAFLEIPIDEARWPSILEHCSFEYMKRHATRSTPLGGAFWDGGAATFIHQGTNGRWQGVLSTAESAKYEAAAARQPRTRLCPLARDG